jgi:ribA/ribD-fused uncharacterized protein
MGDPPVISYFDSFEGPNEYAFLSNFYVGSPLHFGPYTYASGEHMFQAFKATNKADHLKIARTGTPAEAKQEGKHYLRLRGDWERVKYDVMRLVLATKFRLNREEGPLLLATGDALLVEGTMWGDRVWGVDLKAGRAGREQLGAHARATGAQVNDSASWDPGEPWHLSPGRNWLGTLLVARRCELYAQQRGTLSLDYSEVVRFATSVPR